MNTMFGITLCSAALLSPTAADAQGKPAPEPPTLEREQVIQGQEWSFEPGEREVKLYVREPDGGINADTGFMLMLHNWGGTWEQTVPWCDHGADRFNVIAISVNYLQSGWRKETATVPYDYSYLQAMDCLRAIQHVRKQLIEKGVAFSDNRYYAAGGSGGGNVSLLVNKYAPHTFAAVIDMCGMPGPSDDYVYGQGGYSRDPQSPFYFTDDMRDIRDPAHADHLKQHLEINPDNKVIIVHGLDDGSCSATGKILIYHKMITAGFHPDGHFLTPWHVQEYVGVHNTEHPIGNRWQVIQAFGDHYLKPDGALAASTTGPSDFTRGKDVVFPCTNGKYVVHYDDAGPTIEFLKHSR